MKSLALFDCDGAGGMFPEMDGADAMLDIASGGRFHSVLSMQALQASSNIGYIAHGTHHYRMNGRILTILLFSIY